MAELLPYLWLTLSSLGAGAINAIAGGGTLLTFPTLLSVVSPVVANGTSTVALVPGSLAGAWGYRAQIREARLWFTVLIGPSLVGGVVGTYLVILFPDSFAALVPWLILTAATLFLLQPLVRKLRRVGPVSNRPVSPRETVTSSDGRFQTRPTEDPPAGGPRLLGIALFQFGVALYGGYFGAGIGILMLSGLALLGLTHIHQMNGLKNILGSCINGSACVVWIANGQVAWEYALPMALASIVGGFLAAHFAQKVPPTLVRWLVILIGFSLAGYYFLRGD